MEMCTYVHIYITTRYIVGYRTSALYSFPDAITVTT